MASSACWLCASSYAFNSIFTAGRRCRLQAAQPGDHIVCMSNGAFGGVHGRLLDALQVRMG